MLLNKGLFFNSSNPVSSRRYSSTIKSATQKCWSIAQHHANLTGDHEATFHPMSIVFRGIRNNFKNLAFLDLYTPKGQNSSIEDYATVFNDNYKFVSTTKYSHIATRFARFGMVIASNPPKISIDVTKSIETLKRQRKVIVAEDPEKDWDISQECEVSGVVPHGKKSVIDTNDVFMIRKVLAGVYYGPAFVNPNYKPSRFTIQIPSLNSEEFKKIQGDTQESLIDFETANQLLERLDEMEAKYLEPRAGFPDAPVLTITSMEEAEFILDNFELTFIDSNVASKLIAEEKQARKESYKVYSFFEEKRKQAQTEIRNISELFQEFEVCPSL
ncbi:MULTISPECIES: hypothetical protein [unclassified Legionella]|uniref:hypothetical protein n=1 Tax=unclassified Legionella TaxID=2622702 RepID=UPI0010558154|nr:MULTISPECIES: hypothetical protein [unclassified Legionella]MDI9819431.1 hypothetical protein [Legionella sp. PL877]